MMMTRILSASMVVICALRAGATDSFTINGKEITVPVPQGFVRVTNEMPVMARIVEQTADPVNDTLGYYVHESDFQAAKAGQVPALRRAFALKVNKELRKATVGKKEFSKLKKTTKRENERVLAQVEAQIPEHMKKVSEGISREFDADIAMSVSKVVPLEPHHEAENSLAFSMFINYGVAVGAEKTEQIVAATTTILNASGVVLFLYGYAPREELEWTRQASMTWAEGVMASNDQPPAGSSGFAFGGKNILKQALIGGVVGGLLALVASVFIFPKRRRG